jgi:uncharacterized membrane protein
VEVAHKLFLLRVYLVLSALVLSYYCQHYFAAAKTGCVTDVIGPKDLIVKIFALMLPEQGAQ